MEKKIIISYGKTPQEAFTNMWDVLQYTDDACLRKESDGWRMRLAIIPPTEEERNQFERTQTRGIGRVGN